MFLVVKIILAKQKKHQKVFFSVNNGFKSVFFLFFLGSLGGLCRFLRKIIIRQLCKPVRLS